MAKRDVTTLEVKNGTRKWLRKIVVLSDIKSYDDLLKIVRTLVESSSHTKSVNKQSKFLSDFVSNETATGITTSVEVKNGTRYWMRCLVDNIELCTGYNELIYGYFKPFLEDLSKSKSVEKIATTIRISMT